MATNVAIPKFVDAKDPADVLDFDIDFTNLLETTEEIDTLTGVTISPTTAPPLTLDSSAIVTPANKVIRVVLSAGLVCQDYLITAKVVTDDAVPRTFKRSCALRVEDR